jgi:ribosomal protein L24E
MNQDFSSSHYSLLRRLRDFDFSNYQRHLVELVLEKSFGQGRAKAYFPKLECFVVLARMSRGNASETLSGLVRARVIEKCGIGVYAIRLPVEQWAVPMRLEWTQAVREVDAWLNQEPAQLEMSGAGADALGEPPSLSQALRELAGTTTTNFPALCRDAVRSGDRRYVGQASAPQAVRDPVPDSGTVPENGMGVPESGTLGVSRCGSGAADAVPDSGTAHTYKRNNVSSEERITSKRVPVPDSGTSAGQADPKLRDKVLEFVGERDWRRYWEWPEYQEIFEDPFRAKILAGCLRFCRAKLREGVPLRKNPGSMLWDEYKRDLGKKLSQPRAS